MEEDRTKGSVDNQSRDCTAVLNFVDDDQSKPISHAIRYDDYSNPEGKTVRSMTTIYKCQENRAPLFSTNHDLMNAGTFDNIVDAEHLQFGPLNRDEAF